MQVFDYVFVELVQQTMGPGVEKFLDDDAGQCGNPHCFSSGELGVSGRWTPVWRAWVQDEYRVGTST